MHFGYLDHPPPLNDQARHIIGLPPGLGQFSAPLSTAGPAHPAGIGALGPPGSDPYGWSQVARREPFGDTPSRRWDPRLFPHNDRRDHMGATDINIGVRMNIKALLAAATHYERLKNQGVPGDWDELIRTFKARAAFLANALKGKQELDVLATFGKADQMTKDYLDGLLDWGIKTVGDASVDIATIPADIIEAYVAQMMKALNDAINSGLVNLGASIQGMMLELLKLAPNAFKEWAKTLQISPRTLALAGLGVLVGGGFLLWWSGLLGAALSAVVYAAGGALAAFATVAPAGAAAAAGPAGLASLAPLALIGGQPAQVGYSGVGARPVILDLYSQPGRAVTGPGGRTTFSSTPYQQGTWLIDEPTL